MVVVEAVVHNSVEAGVVVTAVARNSVEVGAVVTTVHNLAEVVFVSMMVYNLVEIAAVAVGSLQQNNSAEIVMRVVVETIHN